MSEVIQVDDANVKVALGKFRIALAETEPLMGQIGAAMLLSIRRTFRGKGSPDGSWAPLAPSTIRSDPKKYGAGHQLLIDKGTLLNSINFQARPGSVVIGTNLRYAAVHQFGSRDRGGIPGGVGPRTEKQEAATVNVKEHTYDRVQAPLGKGRTRITDSRGRKRAINMLIAGPRNATRVHVGSHKRHQNIPARPYLVFRPEDPGRIQSLVNAYFRKAAGAAGLEEVA